jgi:hypothetical protein
MSGPPAGRLLLDEELEEDVESSTDPKAIKTKKLIDNIEKNILNFFIILIF